MITSSITAQCYPLRIIHIYAIYTLNEIYLPLCIVRRLRCIFDICRIWRISPTFFALPERVLAVSIVELILLSDVGVPFAGIVGSSIQYHGWFVLAMRNLARRIFT